MITAYFDGLCEPSNPGGYACGGYVIEPHAAMGDRPVFGHECFGDGPEWTNNRAEYEAALLALKKIWRSGYRGPVTLKGDSQLVVRQFTGQYACNMPALQSLLARLRKASEAFESLTLEWVPREENEAADEQSRMAYRAATGKEVRPRSKSKASR